MFRLLRSRQTGLTIYTAVAEHTVGGTAAGHCGHFRAVFEL